jgi:hypothetical protein
MEIRSPTENFTIYFHVIINPICIYKQVRIFLAEHAAVGFDVLTTCQPSTVWCSREKTASGGCSVGQGSSELWRHGLVLLLLIIGG